MIPLNKISDEIFIAADHVVRFSDDEVDFLVQQAHSSPRKRARICAHKTTDDPLHEMLIAILSDSYIHPHKHLNKSESFHVVKGIVDVIIFNDTGGIIDVIELGYSGSGRQFYYRLSESKFHTLLIHTDFLVIHEVTNGPFIKESTLFAPFAPAEGQKEAELKFKKSVTEQVAQYFRDTKS